MEEPGGGLQCEKSPIFPSNDLLGDAAGLAMGSFYDFPAPVLH